LRKRLEPEVHEPWAVQEVPRSGAFGSKPKKPETKQERVVVAASGFTSLWALTWMGAEAMAVNTAIQGGFAVGSVMAGSGLALLWWKTRTMKQLQTDEEAREHAEAEEAPLDAQNDPQDDASSA
jgi:hypothetical protein